MLDITQLVSAPTMTNDDADKEVFYDHLNSVRRSVPFRDHLFLLGDFNAQVGRDVSTWPKVLGHHSVGNKNSNGSLLLQTCSEHELAITNTYYQQANKYKPGSIHALNIGTCWIMSLHDSVT